MPSNKIAIGNFKELNNKDALKAAIAEFIATVTFVFPAEGCNLLMGHTLANVGQVDGIFTACISHAFALFVGVTVAMNVSGGHASPAVTFGALVGGHITLVRSILYFFAQMFGALSSVYLLKFATGGLELAIYLPTQPWNAVLFEIVMTFLLVYVYYATIFDPKKGNLGIIGPLAIGLMVGANLLSGGAMQGAAMNPAIAFCQAFMSWTWTYHWVYWLGTFSGAALAALVYETVFMDDDIYEQLPITIK